MNLLLSLGVVASAWGVWLDAVRHNIGRTDRKQGFFDFNQSPGGWACSVLLLWVVAAPAYLLRRRQLINAGRLADPAGKGWLATVMALLISLIMLVVSGLPVLHRHFGPGFDRQLDTASPEALQQSFASTSAMLHPRQGEAINWAVSELAAVDLIERYPHASPRQIVRGEALNTLKQIEQQLNELKPRKAAIDQILGEMAKLKPQVIEAAPVAEEAGGFALTLDLQNGSRYAFSQLWLKAQLYLDDKREPSAETTLLADFNRSNGLLPGQSTRLNFNLASGFDDRAWKTIEVRTARRHRVVLSVLPERAMDLGERPVLNDNVDQTWNTLLAQKKQVEYLLAIANEPLEMCLFSCGSP